MEIDANLDLIKVKPLKGNSVLHETLTRMGTVQRDKIIPEAYAMMMGDVQSSDMYLVHFSQVGALTANEDATPLTQEEYDKLASIADMLETWGIIEIIDDIDDFQTTPIGVIKYHAKQNYRVTHRINMKWVSEHNRKFENANNQR